MRLGVTLCKQTTDFTCGACATLMVWRYFDRNVQRSKRNEFLVWTEIVALPFKFSSPYRIAAFFIKKGFETKLLMKQGMSGEGRILLECCQTDPAERELFLNFFKAHNRILKRHITSAILDRNPTLLDIRRALSNHNPVIALVDSYYTSKARGARNPPHLPHWIVIRGYEGEKFHVNDRMREGRSFIMETSFEEITKKYRLMKAGKINVDLLSLKSEIEFYIKNRQGAKRKDDDSIVEAQDMLLDVTQMIEEGHCNPFRPKKL